MEEDHILDENEYDEERFSTAWHWSDVFSRHNKEEEAKKKYIFLSYQDKLRVDFPNYFISEMFPKK